MKTSLLLIICVSLIFFVSVSCEDFVKIDTPVSELVRSSVFSDDETACRAILGIYADMGGSDNFGGGRASSITFIASLSSDELINGSAGFRTEYNDFNNNTLLWNNSRVNALWENLYQSVYRANSIIEGVTSSSNISEGLKNQLVGEAKFIRAFAHFYLVNLWGDVPLVLTTDYQKNASLLRTPVQEVYSQIVEDLQDSQALLNSDYVLPDGITHTSERVRPTKWAALALLARVQLFTKDYVNAEINSTAVINNTSAYSLTTLSDIFLKNSREAIWQLSRDGNNAYEGRFFRPTVATKNGVLTTSLNNAFESGDNRRVQWIGTFTGGVRYPAKYKATHNGEPVTEYSTVLRLSEQYLIRAEARVQQENISGAKDDLNVIRSRAGLGNTTANEKATLLSAIEQERRVELFVEWGHRWLDLKRMGRVNEVMSLEKPKTWETTDELYPIPSGQISANPVITQNPGYDN